MTSTRWLTLTLLGLSACEPELPAPTNAAHNVREPVEGGAAGAGGASAGAAGLSGGKGGASGGAGGASGAASAGAPSGGGGGARSSVGDACKVDADCKGYAKASCVTSIAPLKGKITDPTHPQASKFENELVMPFPNGYCATTIENSCKSDADCGVGAGCFRGLDGVDKAVLADLDMQKTADGMHPFLPFSTVAFADVGICLEPCSTNADCRQSEGYTCAVPMGTLIGVINSSYTRTFCVGPFTFML